MEELDSKYVDWIRSLPLVEKKQIKAFSDASFTGGTTGEEKNDTSHFDQLLDVKQMLAIYGHVHKQLLRYGSKGQQILNLRLGCLILIGHLCKITGPSMP